MSPCRLRLLDPVLPGAMWVCGYAADCRNAPYSCLRSRARPEHPAHLACTLPPPLLQGAFKKVASEVEACARELAGILRRRLLAAPDQAAECIQMIAKLGEPTESLQVGWAAGWCQPASRVGCAGTHVGLAAGRVAAIVGSPAGPSRALQICRQGGLLEFQRSQAQAGLLKGHAKLAGQAHYAKMGFDATRQHQESPAVVQVVPRTTSYHSPHACLSGVAGGLPRV